MSVGAGRWLAFDKDCYSLRVIVIDHFWLCTHLYLFNTVLSAVFVCVRIRETWRSKNNNYTQVLQFSKKAQGKQFKAARM